MNKTFPFMAANKNNRILMPLVFAALFVSLSTGSVAQSSTVSFTLLHQPCNNDGILVAYDSVGVPPVTFQYYVAGQQYTHVSNSAYDTLFSYSGAPVSVTAGSGSPATAYGYYAGSPPFTFTDTTTAAACPVLGTARATVTGGTPPYSYQWSDMSNTVVATGNPVNLPAGGYSILITDGAGCTYGMYSGGIGSNYAIYIRNITSIVDTIRTTVANCTNGTAAVTSVTGGHAPYSYLWSNGANTSSISGLMMGNYVVTITDSLGCFNTGYAYVQQSVTITGHTTITNATCRQNDGSIIAFGSGGTPPYSYLWNNGQTAATVTGLVAGLYTITINDANSCIGYGEGNVTAATPITVTYTTTASSCTAPTGSATLHITGGTHPYTVNWSAYPPQTGVTATGLISGNYFFSVTDSVGCTQTGTVHVPPVSLVGGHTLETDAQCTQSNGSATMIVTIGTSPYVYQWSNGGATPTISGLAAGYYTCTITDVYACTTTKSAIVHAATPIVLGLNTTDASCIFSADGGIVATVSGGTMPYTYNWSNGQTTANASGLLTGRYYVYVNDAAGCVQNSWTDVSYNAANDSCYCTLTGTVYNDLNTNCVIDSGEPGIQNIMIHCSGRGYAFTNPYGVYTIIVPSGNYTLSEDVESYFPLAPCQNNAINVSVTAASGCVSNQNFADVVNPIHDVRIVTTSFNPAVIGYTYAQKIVVENNGSITEPGIQMGYAHDGQLVYTGVVPGLFTQQDPVGLPNWYSIDTAFLPLTPGSRQVFSVDYNVPANIPLGTQVDFHDTVSYTAPISNWLNDYTPWNNVDAYQVTTVGSFDPNEKEVSPLGTGVPGYISTSDSVLNYTVRFQNRGSYPAQKVVVVDTLDAHLNITTLRPGYSNYAYTATASENGVVTFTFNNINLPDSMSQPVTSIGILMYSVHLKPHLPGGTQIKSPASVYFDFNQPVRTNTTLNTITSVTDVPEAVKPPVFDFTMYPNPATGFVTLVVNTDEVCSNSFLKFYNVLGELVQTREIKLDQGKNLVTANISALSTGLYFAEITAGQHSQVQKLSVMK